MKMYLSYMNHFGTAVYCVTVIKMSFIIVLNMQ